MRSFTITLLLAYLYFVRSGYVHINNGRLWYAGIYGYWWSSIAASNIWGSAGLGAYYLNFSAANVYSSGGPNYRWVSFPLRQPSGQYNESRIHDNDYLGLMDE